MNAGPVSARGKGGLLPVVVGETEDSEGSMVATVERRVSEIRRIFQKIDAEISLLEQLLSEFAIC